MVRAFETKDKNLVSASWRTALLPCLQIVVLRGDGIDTEGFLVLWTCGGVATVWPVKLYADQITVVSDVLTVQHRVIKNLDICFVVPTAGASPLRSLIMREKKPSIPIGTQLLITGKLVKLLDWHRSRGFANVSEATLQRLCEEVKVPTWA